MQGFNGILVIVWGDYGLAARILVVEDEGIIAMDMRFQPSRGRCVTARFGDRAQSHTHGYSFGWKRGWNRGCQEDRAKPSSPVIYLTTHADIGTMVRANDTSSAGYLLKSFEPEELRSAVKRPLRPIEPEGILGSKGPFPARLYLPSGIPY
jgi:CheY-like chemotaxis protein